jgi:hypothetical protein
MDDSKPAQAVIAPFAALLTAYLWLESWLEILTRGAYHSPDDLSKLYLAIMAAYAGAAEISKWLNNEPTIPGSDPMFERIHRGGFFVWLWLVPLLFAYGWRITNPAIPMPGPLQKITIGLVGIFFLKAASRRWRHKQHGVIDPVTGLVDDNKEESSEEADADFVDVLCQRIATSPNGASIADMTTAFPDTSRPTLFRALDKLVKAKRVTRTGKPRTPEVRYRASSR